jgi:uncharacterized membrane protein
MRAFYSKEEGLALQMHPLNIMDNEKVIETLEAQHWLQPVEDALQAGLQRTIRAGGESGKKVEDFLHGTWLGHPLHAAITDIPVGAWSAAVALDAIEGLSGNANAGKAADSAIGIGLIGAVGAAVTGLNDWQTISDEKPRRVGLIHGLTNITAFTLFTASFIARRRQSRRLGKVLSSAGFALALGGAWLGGHLTYKYGVGVDSEVQDQRDPRGFPLNAVV